MPKKFTSTVAGASLLISFVGIISRGFGFIREMIFANYFGLGIDFDIYLVGAVLPITINSIILYLGQNYFIPAYNKVKRDNDKTSDEFLNVNFWLFALIGAVLGALLLIFSNEIMHTYLQSVNEANIKTAEIIFRIFLFTIPVSASSSILIAYLHNQFEFKYPAFAQLFLNAVIIIAVPVLSDRLGIFIIPVGYAAGSLLQLIYLLTKVKGKIKVAFRSQIYRQVYSSLKSTIVIIIFIESVGQVYQLIDRYFFFKVDAGGIAALNYAQTIFLLPLSVFTMALATAIFPKFSELYSKKLLSEMESTLADGIRISIFVFIPVTFIFFFYGDFLIKLFFERGRFSAADTLLTASVLKYLSVSLVLYSIYAIFNKILYSAAFFKELFAITLIACILKITLNVYFVEPLKQDGLALSTSVTFLFFFLCSIFWVHHKLKFKNTKLIFYELIIHFVNVIVSYLLADMISGIITGHMFIQKLISIIFLAIIYLINLYFIDHRVIKILKDVTVSLRNLNVKEI